MSTTTPDDAMLLARIAAARAAGVEVGWDNLTSDQARRLVSLVMEDKHWAGQPSPPTRLEPSPLVDDDPPWL